MAESYWSRSSRSHPCSPTTPVATNTAVWGISASVRQADWSYQLGGRAQMSRTVHPHMHRIMHSSTVHAFSSVPRSESRRPCVPERWLVGDIMKCGHRRLPKVFRPLPQHHAGATASQEPLAVVARDWRQPGLHRYRIGTSSPLRPVRPVPVTSFALRSQQARYPRSCAPALPW